MLCKICGLDTKTKQECAWTSCPKNFEEEEWNEERIDVIGQNGNDGLHYNEKDSQ